MTRNHFPGQEHLPSRVPEANPTPTPQAVAAQAANKANPVARRATAVQAAITLKPQNVTELLNNAAAIDAFLSDGPAPARQPAGATIYKALQDERGC